MRQIEEKMSAARLRLSLCTQTCETNKASFFASLAFSEAFATREEIYSNAGGRDVGFING